MTLDQLVILIIKTIVHSPGTYYSFTDSHTLRATFGPTFSHTCTLGRAHKVSNSNPGFKATNNFCENRTMYNGHNSNDKKSTKQRK